MRPDAAGGAVHQPDAEPLLEVDAAAGSGWRPKHPAPAPRAGNSGCGRRRQRHRYRADPHRSLSDTLNNPFNALSSLSPPIKHARIFRSSQAASRAFAARLNCEEETPWNSTNSASTGPRKFPPLASAAWGCRIFTVRPTASESIATIHAAIEAGITLLDTGDFYGMGHNEMLIREALGRGTQP